MTRCGIALLALVAACGAAEPPAADVPTPAFLSKEWLSRAVIYEVNVRQSTPEGTFDAFRQQHLARLDSLGVDILWLMPIHPIGVQGRKGTLGSYYAVKDYTGVNPEYGTLDDFKVLVAAAHERGMAVILDWVANHTAPDHPWTTAHPDWYTRDKNGRILPPVPDWSDVADLNYGVPAMREEMIRSLEYWLKEAGIDGYRCDVAEMVPLDFWKDARRRLDAIKPVFMLAEGEKPELHGPFDMTYSWTFHRQMNAMTKGEKQASDLAAYWKAQDTTYQPADLRMQFTTNHDENSWNGTEHERLGDARLAFAVLSFVVKGIPLIYTGQEADMNKRLRFFDKDTVGWDGYASSPLYRKLTALKKSARALDADGTDQRFLDTGNARVAAIIRQKGESQVVTLLNFSADSVTISVADSALRGKYTSLFDGGTTTAAGTLQTRLPAHGYHVEVKK